MTIKLKKKQLFLLIALLFCACGAPKTEVTPSNGEEYVRAPDSSIMESSAEESFEADLPEQKTINYVRDTADELISTLIEPGMDDTEKILAAYRYLIENVYFAEPVGLDMWYYRGQKTPPDFTELRALSPIAFGIGSCEDFACAMVVLLEQMGFEAIYVPGYTISVHGDYVDHAWTVVRMGDKWYHLDPQLEQNIVRQNIIKYRYFLKSDDDIIHDHKWGENLIFYWRDISDEDARLIRSLYTPPACEQSMPQLSEYEIELPGRPDVYSLLDEFEHEKRASGLSLIETPDISPPVLIH